MEKWIKCGLVAGIVVGIVLVLEGLLMNGTAGYVFPGITFAVWIASSLFMTLVLKGHSMKIFFRLLGLSLVVSIFVNYVAITILMRLGFLNL